jgi:catechol 2,3-dioxygenase-like lactoylglutathione lyase family enzyme
MRVKDLEYSLTFYREVMRFTLVSAEETKGVAVVKAPAGETVVLAMAAAEEVSAYLTPVYDQPGPGKHLYFQAGPDFASYRERLLSLPDAKAAWRETEWGWEWLLVEDPDGVILSFWGGRELRDEEILHFYDLGPEQLQQALAGLDEADLDLRRAPGKWSIRELVLHLVDSDATSLALVKFALAEPGRSFHGNAYDPDVWARGLDYAHRPIQAEVALFTAIRRHVGGLLRHLPGALDRHVTLSGGQTVTVRQRIEPLMGHALHHIEQIWETRRVHQR